VLIRTYILDIKQQNEVKGCISNSFNVVKIPKATKVLSIIDVPKKRLVFKMRLIAELNAHPPSKLPLNRLKQIHCRTCVKEPKSMKLKRWVFFMMFVSSWKNVRS
jgi:hypothetical protein